MPFTPDKPVAAAQPTTGFRPDVPAAKPTRTGFGIRAEGERRPGGVPGATRAGTPGGLLGQKAGDGIFGRFIQGRASPFTKTLASGLAVAEATPKLIGGDVAGAQEALSRERQFGVFGGARPIGTVQETGEEKSTVGGILDIFGTGLEIGTTVIGGGVGAQTVKTGARAGLGQAFKAGARVGAPIGGLEAGAVSLQEEREGETLGESITDIVKDIGIGTGAGLILGGVLNSAAPSVSRAFGRASGAVREGREQFQNRAAIKVDEFTSKIIQGKRKDIAASSRALNEIDTSDVRTYSDLFARTNDEIAARANKLDETLLQDVRKFDFDDFDVTFKKGKRETTKNTVKDAIDNLEELYEKTNDAERLVNIQNLRDTIDAAGISIKEVNDLSRVYGQEFGKKAFGKTGDPLTSVNAVRFENTRSGLKEAARNKFKGDLPKELDRSMSNMFTLQKNIEKMAEKVQGLSQRVESRNLVERFSRKLADVADVATFGGPKAFVTRFLIPSNVGQKTLNSLDLERQLSKNLRNLDKALDGSDDDIIDFFINLGKGSGGPDLEAIQAGGGIEIEL